MMKVSIEPKGVDQDGRAKCYPRSRSTLLDLHFCLMIKTICWKFIICVKGADRLYINVYDERFIICTKGADPDGGAKG